MLAVANPEAPSLPHSAETETATESETASKPAASQRSAWFIASCLLLPVVWGVLVHQVFSRLRKKQRPDRSRETGWPDYQI